MDASTFALWKYKNFEGKLRGFHASEFNTTKFWDDNGQEYNIRYDTSSEDALIVKKCEDHEDNVWFGSFNGLEEALKRLGFYNLREN